MFYWLSQKWVWLPVYIVIAWFLYRRGGWKGLLFMAGLVGLGILLADQAASGLLKPLVARPRPCHEPVLEAVVHLVRGKCGGPYGFASSHAANFFAMAVLFAQFLRLPYWGRFGALFLASMVAYSRIYLGVHYPGDVVVGAMLGLVSAIVVIWLGRKMQGWLKLETMV